MLIYMQSPYIFILTFLASFIVGLIFVYLLGPETKSIFVYPSPTNYTSTLYKDNVNQCFNFKPEVTKCPFNPFDINTIPVQAA